MSSTSRRALPPGRRELKARPGLQLDSPSYSTGAASGCCTTAAGGRSANIDHIAVGPGGITVIDTKNYRGKVRVERVGGMFSERRDILTIAGRDKTNLIDGVERQMTALWTALADQDGSLELRGALCFADIDGLPLLRHLTVRGVIVDGPRTTAKLARRPGPLTPAQVDTLWTYLGTALALA